ncbi:hypothetical protein ABLE91_11100 [Aquabacter sp. CN5-332]|uniref:hypothetical protein n=1 Tax=Aquabacter sp. CN5-332 TaxID=3156608 RepID=UPI0032B610F0
MSDIDQINTLLAAAQSLAARAEQDPALAERLLAAPHDVISQEAGCPFPDGIDIQAARDETGALQITASIDSKFEGELNDALLDHVSGGKSMNPELLKTGGDEKMMKAKMPNYLGSIKK